jgi:predicted nucleic acid-binding protein
VYTTETLSGLADSGGLVVPGNFHAEVIQTLLRAARTDRLSSREVSEAIAGLDELGAEVVHAPSALVAALAQKHLLSAYDAGYLAVALVRGVPLLTLEKVEKRKLGAAARSEGCLWPSAFSPLIVKRTTRKAKRKGRSVA